MKYQPTSETIALQEATLPVCDQRRLGLGQSFAKCFSTFGPRGRERNCAKFGLKGGWIAARPSVQSD